MHFVALKPPPQASVNSKWVSINKFEVPVSTLKYLKFFIQVSGSSRKGRTRLTQVEIMIWGDFWPLERYLLHSWHKSHHAGGPLAINFIGTELILLRSIVAFLHISWFFSFVIISIINRRLSLSPSGSICHRGDIFSPFC